MITLQWQSADRTHTETIETSEQLGRITSMPVAIAQAVDPVTLTISSDEQVVRVVHMLASVSVPLLHVKIRATQPQQRVAYATDAARTSTGLSLQDMTVEVVCEAPESYVEAVCTLHTRGSETISLHTQQQHRVPHTRSSVVIRGVSEEKSRAMVDSIIAIPEGVVGVSADQVHKHLLLDDQSRAYSDPKLEVSNDDVSCSHGAAIRYCDEEQLFFLRARGIDEQTARKTIISAFLGQKIEIDGMKQTD